MLGFLYRPHKDHPEIPESVRACFVGVEVTDLGDHRWRVRGMGRGGPYWSRRRGYGTVAACCGDETGRDAHQGPVDVGESRAEEGDAYLYGQEANNGSQIIPLPISQSLADIHAGKNWPKIGTENPRTNPRIDNPKLAWIRLL